MTEINFKGKTEVVNHHLAVPTPVIVPKYKLDKKNKVSELDSEDNLIIKGDNLLALKALLPTHKGRVKCIYIDPPYNTKNEGWCYNDNVNSPLMKEWLGKVVDGEDQTRHDKWLCMMYPRLHLLRELLSDDGVIFISIDNNEQHRLHFIMNEIFGEENFISSFHVEMSTTQGMKVASAKKGGVVKNAEFVLFYCKAKETLNSFTPLYEAKDWDTHYSIYYDHASKKRISLNEFINEELEKRHSCD